MKNCLWGIALFISFSTFAQNNYLELIGKFSQMSNQLCQGLSIVASCGNQVCESTKQETSANCPQDCTQPLIRSYNDIVLCQKYIKKYYPKSREEIEQIVVKAKAQGQSIKVLGNSHSANSIMCGDGVALVMSQMNHIYGIEKFQGKDTVHLQAGAVLGEVTDYLDTKGFSLGFAVMGFRGVTIGGAIGTASHGSSPKHSAVISSLVESIGLIDSNGKYFEHTKLNTPEDEWKALTAHLGLLGIITDIRLKLEPQFNLDVHVTYHNAQKITQGNGLIDEVKNCDYALINWFPGTGEYVKTCGIKTNQKAVLGAKNILLSPRIPKSLTANFKRALQMGACFNTVNCLVEKARLIHLKLDPPFRYTENNKEVKAYDIVGPSHKLISSDLTDQQNGLTQMDWEIAIPASKLSAAMNELGQFVKKKKICLPLVGVFIRFALSENKTLLAHTVSVDGFKENELVAFIEMPIFLPAGFEDNAKFEHEKNFYDFAKLLIEKYQGRAHLGKNMDWVFPVEIKLHRYANNLEKFKKVMDKYDPNQMFQNKFSSFLNLSPKEKNKSCDDAIDIVCDKINHISYINSCEAQAFGLKSYQYTKGSCL